MFPAVYECYNFFFHFQLLISYGTNISSSLKHGTTSFLEYYSCMVHVLMKEWSVKDWLASEVNFNNKFSNEIIIKRQG